MLTSRYSASSSFKVSSDENSDDVGLTRCRRLPIVDPRRRRRLPGDPAPPLGDGSAGEAKNASAWSTNCINTSSPLVVSFRTVTKGEFLDEDGGLSLAAVAVAADRFSAWS